MRAKVALGTLTTASDSRAEEAGRVWAQWEIMLQMARDLLTRGERADRLRSGRIGGLPPRLVRLAVNRPYAAVTHMDRGLREAVRDQDAAAEILATWERLLPLALDLPERLDSESERQAWGWGWANERAALDPRSR